MSRKRLLKAWLSDHHLTCDQGTAPLSINLSANFAIVHEHPVDPPPLPPLPLPRSPPAPPPPSLPGLAAVEVLQLLFGMGDICVQAAVLIKPRLVDPANIEVVLLAKGFQYDDEREDARQALA